MKEEQPRKSNKSEGRRIAVPLPPGMVSEEAVRKALENFVAAVREAKYRPLTQEEWESRRRFNRLFLEPLDQKI